MPEPQRLRRTLPVALALPVLIAVGCERGAVPSAAPAPARAATPAMFARRSPGVTPHAAIHITPSVGTAEAADTAARPGWRQHAQPQQDTTFDLEIDADPDIGKAPLTVQFAAVIEVDLPEPLTYHWDFGDGGQDGSNPTRHTYLQAGEYTAMLTAVSGDGRVGTRDVVIQVDPREADDAAAD